jgi:hypothetical protein
MHRIVLGVAWCGVARPRPCWVRVQRHAAMQENAPFLAPQLWSVGRCSMEADRIGPTTTAISDVFGREVVHECVFIMGGCQSAPLCSQLSPWQGKVSGRLRSEQVLVGSEPPSALSTRVISATECVHNFLPTSSHIDAAGNMSPKHSNSAAPSERTPLIPPASSTLPSPSPTLAPSDSAKHMEPSPGSTSTAGLFPPIRRVLFTSFLLSMTFAFTQTSLIYAFRTMTCDEWYKTHPFPSNGEGDVCATPAIEARTAKSVALMSSVTTTCSEWFRGSGFVLETRNTTTARLELGTHLDVLALTSRRSLMSDVHSRAFPLSPHLRSQVLVARMPVHLHAVLPSLPLDPTSRFLVIHRRDIPTSPSNV